MNIETTANSSQVNKTQTRVHGIKKRHHLPAEVELDQAKMAVSRSLPAVYRPIMASIFAIEILIYEG